MSRSLIAYVATLVVFAIVDFTWLGFVAKGLYSKGIGPLMAEKPDMVAAALFYLIFIAGLVYFAVAPGLAAGEWQSAALNGALFGFFCYCTFDLTNQALLKDWPWFITVTDIVWGAVVSAVGATAGFLITRALAH